MGSQAGYIPHKEMHHHFQTARHLLAAALYPVGASTAVSTLYLGAPVLRRQDCKEHCFVYVGDCGALEGKADWLRACALSFETHIDGAWTG
eukprot:1152376-Pelagomonas_calceolata.AAC.2